MSAAVPNLSQALRTANSGLLVNQRVIDTIAQNVANANTDGYSRKNVILENRSVDGVALGVKISEITRSIKDFNFDGVIASNTTVEKSNLVVSSNADLSGGLSGKPLLNKSNELLNFIHLSEPELLKIGVGGVHNKETFNMKLENGASLVQIYTSFIYQGPSIINKLLS